MKRPLLNEALGNAVQVAGGQAALARAIGVRQGHVWDWLFVSGRPPPAACSLIEARTQIQCESLRPDLAWERNDDGQVIGYRVELPTPEAISESPASTGQ